MTPPAVPIRVLVVEDAARTRHALAALLEGTPGFACAGACANAEAALARLRDVRPDVALIDLELPDLDGTGLIRRCRERHPEIQLLVLTVHDEADRVFPALEAGAHGYVVKGTPPAKLLEAIAEVRSGGSFMSGSVARLLLQRFQAAATPRAPRQPLSPREQEVLQLLAKGLRQSAIARELGIAPRTVNTHLHNLYEKLHVHTAAGAVGTLMEPTVSGTGGAS